MYNIYRLDFITLWVSKKFTCSSLPASIEIKRCLCGEWWSPKWKSDPSYWLLRAQSNVSFIEKGEIRPRDRHLSMLVWRSSISPWSVDGGKMARSIVEVCSKHWLFWVHCSAIKTCNNYQKTLYIDLVLVWNDATITQNVLNALIEWSGSWHDVAPLPGRWPLSCEVRIRTFYLPLIVLSGDTEL